MKNYEDVNLEQLNSEVLELREQLEKSNKELENMLYLISHDLQEPLRMISSYVQLIQKRNEGKIDKDTNDYISFAVEGVNKIKHQIEKILFLYRLGSNHLNLSKMDGNELLKHVLIELSKAYDLNKTEITYNKIPELKADRSRLETLFYLIIENFIVLNKNKNFRINISSEELNGILLFSISENNTKPTKDLNNKSLDMIKEHNNNNDAHMNGFDWAIIRKIIEQHKGNLWSEFEEGNRPNIYFTIPCNK